MERLRSHFAKIAHKVAKCKYFVHIQNESDYSIISSPMIYSLLG